MGKNLILKENENGNVSNSSDTEDKLSSRSFKSKYESSSLMMREKIRRRLHRSNETWVKFDENLSDIKKCVLKVVDIIDECRNIAKMERHGNDELLNVLQDNSSNAVTCKTNIVNPMIKGLPLKRVTISLQRLEPIQVQLYERVIPASTISASQRSSNLPSYYSAQEQNMEPSSSNNFTRSHSSHGTGNIAEQ